MPSRYIRHELDPVRKHQAVAREAALTAWYVAGKVQREVEKALQCAKVRINTRATGWDVVAPRWRPFNVPREMFHAAAFDSRTAWVEEDTKEKLFRIRYGAEPTHGTGPFPTFEHAAGWFYSGGR